jgi:hypothetical protein
VAALDMVAGRLQVVHRGRGGPTMRLDHQDLEGFGHVRIIECQVMI